MGQELQTGKGWQAKPVSKKKKLKLLLLLDGHGSHSELSFLKYINNPYTL
jgi:hypothetical protein